MTDIVERLRAGGPCPDPCRVQEAKSGCTCAEAADEITRLRAALDLILAEPHGCVFCDSGKLRNPNKDHDDNCGFAAAIRAGGQE